MKGYTHGGDINIMEHTHGGDMHMKRHTHGETGTQGGNMHMKGDKYGGKFIRRGHTWKEHILK